MKILIIIVTREMTLASLPNIIILKDYMKDYDVEYAGISCVDNFSNYEDVISFKYKIISEKKQLSKVCDFISNNQLDYDWFVKFRPEVKLLQPINFNELSNQCINARARYYRGPQNIIYGSSVGGIGMWSAHYDCYYSEEENGIILDDILYIFHKNIINAGGFIPILVDDYENEWFHAKIWNERNIKFNVIGINLVFGKDFGPDQERAYSTDIRVK